MKITADQARKHERPLYDSTRIEKDFVAAIADCYDGIVYCSTVMGHNFSTSNLVAEELVERMTAELVSSGFDVSVFPTLGQSSSFGTWEKASRLLISWNNGGQDENNGLERCG